MDIRKTLDKLLHLKIENEVVEFKEAKTQFDKDKLGKYFSALSNEANLKGLRQAWLVFGVADNRTIVGTAITDRQINEYKSEIGKHTSPHCTFIEVHRVKKSNMDVLLFEIPASPRGQAMSWKGHYYGRDGESLVALSPLEYDQITQRPINEDWSAQIIEEATIEDLCPEAIERARVEYTRKNPKMAEEISSWSDETFLNKAKITIKGAITNTAIVLLGKSESEYLISPAVAKITWILREKDGVEKDYEHFTCPFILSVEKVRAKVRNLKYRYLKDTLFPEEVDQYDDYTIREALNNCIAHQDYTMGGKIILVENEDGFLVFSNRGDFIPKSIEYVITSDAPEERYRNRFLAEAMVNLNMIDTIGSGIKRLFDIQRKKFFPLPDYDLSDSQVKVTIMGKIMDLNFARKVAELPTLTLEEIMLLDNVAKGKKLTNEEAKSLKKKKLIEGRKPNYYISSTVAKATDQKEDYLKLRGFGINFERKLILEYLSKFKEGKRKNFENLLMDKMPDSLSDEQKRYRVKNNLTYLRQEGYIEVKDNRTWVLTKK